MRRGRRYRQRQCTHAHAECIHGDGIIATGYKRGFCPECVLFLDALPEMCRVTGKPHPIAASDSARGVEP